MGHDSFRNSSNQSFDRYIWERVALHHEEPLQRAFLSACLDYLCLHTEEGDLPSAFQTAGKGNFDAASLSSAWRGGRNEEKKGKAELKKEEASIQSTIEKELQQFGVFQHYASLQKAFTRCGFHLFTYERVYKACDAYIDQLRRSRGENAVTKENVANLCLQCVSRLVFGEGMKRTYACTRLCFVAIIPLGVVCWPREQGAGLQ